MKDVRRILDAVAAFSSDLDLPVILRRIIVAACELADAEYGALGVLSRPSPDGAIHLAEFITHGVSDGTTRAIGRLPSGLGILGHIIREPRPLRLHDLTTHPDSSGFPDLHPPMRTFLGVPLPVGGEIYGNLYLTEKRGGGDFTEDDEQLVTGLAGMAGVAVQMARLHARVREFAVLEDRERIARDLHDTVIQRLFATGLSLQGITHIAGSAEVGDRIQQAVDDLDGTIRDIRGAIFALQAHERGEQSLRVMVLALANEVAPALGFEPRVHFDGPVDTAISTDLGESMLVVLRELLSNAVKHAHASSVDIHLRVGVEITLAVIDDGVGGAAERRGGQGMRNLRHRAQSLGGDFTVEPAEERGIVATWRVPRQVPPLPSGSGVS